MKLSVIIPAYKAHHTLPTLLSSLRIQTFKDFEVIISNDNPNDNYKDIIEQFKDLNIKEITTNKNTGPGLSRQRGLEAAEGDFITFIDADDLFTEFNAFENVMKAFAQSPNSAAIQFSFLQENDNYIYIPMNNPRRPWVFAIFYNRKFLVNNKIKFPAFRSMEDACFNYQVRLLTDGTTYQVKDVNMPIYLWKKGSEHSITRTTCKTLGDIPVYNYSLCRLGAAQACLYALEFINKINPFNTNIAKFAAEQLVGSYYTYYETPEVLKDYAWFISKFIYNKIFKIYAPQINSEILSKLALSGIDSVKKIGKLPELTFEQWLNKIKEEEYDEEEFVKIRKALPKDIIEAEIKSGSVHEEEVEDPKLLLNCY